MRLSSSPHFSTGESIHEETEKVNCFCAQYNQATSAHQECTMPRKMIGCTEEKKATTRSGPHLLRPLWVLSHEGCFRMRLLL